MTYTVISPSSKLEQAMTVLLTLATLVAAGVLVEGRINRSSAAAPRARTEEVDDWARHLADVGVPLGDKTRPVQLAVFTDFECPFCQRMDSVLTDLDRRHPGKISQYVIHFPLGMHRAATGAATAFECAARLGSAAQMHHVLFWSSTSLQTEKWSQFAQEAGVADASRFTACVNADEGRARIAAGVAFGESLGVSGTPAVIVNGWLFDPSTPAAVNKAVAAILRGSSPKP